MPTPLPGTRSPARSPPRRRRDVTIDGLAAAVVGSVATNEPAAHPDAARHLVPVSRRPTRARSARARRRVTIGGKAAARAGRPGAHLQRPDRRRHQRDHVRRRDGDDRMTDFLGRGWALPDRSPTRAARCATSTATTTSTQSLRLLLATGCGRARDAPALRHRAPASWSSRPARTTNLRALEAAVREAVARPRAARAARRRRRHRRTRSSPSGSTSRSPTRCGAPTPARASSSPTTSRGPGGLP